MLERTVFPVRAITAVLLTAALLLPTGCSCGSASGGITEGGQSQSGSVMPDNGGTQSPTASTSAPNGTHAEELSSGNLGDYHVEIGAHRTGTDYDGNPVIFVTYSFTNNSSEAEAFMWAVRDVAYQNDIQLETAIVLDDEKYDSDAALLEIRNGATVTVEQAYVLRNTSDPVEVEVTELISFGDERLSKRFELSDGGQ